MVEMNDQGGRGHQSNKDRVLRKCAPRIGLRRKRIMFYMVGCLSW